LRRIPPKLERFLNLLQNFLNLSGFIICIPNKLGNVQILLEDCWLSLSLRSLTHGGFIQAPPRSSDLIVTGSRTKPFDQGSL
jgi:hypothetical protein